VAYELIIKDNVIEVHWDLCDKVMEHKDNFELNNEVEYINLIDFSEVEEFLKKDEYQDFEIVYCDVCAPKENQDRYNEEYDDFYEEFADDDEIDNSRCDIF
jgi:hypothetical protein